MNRPLKTVTIERIENGYLVHYYDTTAHFQTIEQVTAFVLSFYVQQVAAEQE